MVILICFLYFTDDSTELGDNRTQPVDPVTYSNQEVQGHGEVAEDDEGSEVSEQEIQERMQQVSMER